MSQVSISGATAIFDGFVRARERGKELVLTLKFEDRGEFAGTTPRKPRSREFLFFFALILRFLGDEGKKLSDI